MSGDDRLCETLRGMVLPGDDELAVLRSVFGGGPSARQAWRAFRATLAEPAEILSLRARPMRSFLPLLCSVIEQHGIDEDPRLLTILRSALLTERLRAERYAAIAHDMLEQLEDEGIDPVVLKGAAVGPLYYREPAHRHAHDLEILVARDARHHAVRRLRGLGFVRARTIARGETKLLHTTGLPVRVHSSLRSSGLQIDPSSATMTRELYGVQCRALSRTAGLVHALVHAFSSPSRASLRWVGDVVMLVGDGGAIDWDELVETAKAGGAALALFLQFEALVRALDLPVPAGTIDALAEASERDGATMRRFAVERAWAGSMTDWATLFRAAERLTLRLAMIRSLFTSPPHAVARLLESPAPRANAPEPVAGSSTRFR